MVAQTARSADMGVQVRRVLIHPDYEGVILARLSGEHSFIWVHDLGDAYQAAASRGGGDVVVTREFRDDLLAYGASPLEALAIALGHGRADSVDKADVRG